MYSIWCFGLLAAIFSHSVKSQALPVVDVPESHNDLATYISQPDLKPPLFKITHFDESRVTPGYWFLAPYDDLQIELVTTKAPILQIGANIYDQSGELVWSSAPLYKNRVTFDFRAVTMNGTPHLSFILQHDQQTNDEEKGFAVIMDSHYEIQQKFYAPRTSNIFNMHEFNIINDGRSALIVTYESVWDNVQELGPRFSTAFVGNNGFQETDLVTGEKIFEWWCMDHVPLTASWLRLMGVGSFDASWDWFHINSVDKNADGDYLVSARHASTIYKISGRDGSIIWQLGGYNSSFVQDGWDFSFQHDARFREENSSTTIISFLNNASNGFQSLKTANISSALFVALRTDVSPMTATIISQIDRPDGGQTELRGNVQQLPNDNVFVAWSENGYITEHTASGDLVLEARFTSDRFVNYRAYKFDFVGLPHDPPTMKAYAYGTTASTVTSVYYVSWNGATEVAEWRFYGNGFGGSDFELIGSLPKKGFETMLMSAGYQRLAYVEGIAADGKVLGRSVASETIVPAGWEFTNCTASSCAIPAATVVPFGYPVTEDETASAPSYSGGSWHDSLFLNIAEVLSISVIFAVLVGLIVYIVFRLWQRQRAQRASHLYKEVQYSDGSVSSIEDY